MTPPPAARAVLVAGGRGTRIRSISGDLIPKALVPVAGEPIVFRQLELLARHGVREVAVLAGHLADELRAGMAPRARELGIELRFFVERTPLGTAGGLPAARAFLAGTDFVVIYADVAVEMDLDRLRDRHRESGAAATIVAHPNDHPHDSDLIRCDDGDRVVEILPKHGRIPADYPNLVPAAVYFAGDGLFQHLSPGAAQDFIRDVFPRMVASGAPVLAYRTPEYLRDMGTPERYAMVERDLESGLVARMRFSNRRPAVFFDRDGVINREVGGHGLVRVDQLDILPGSPRAVRRVNDAGWLAVLVTNQPQIAKGLVSAAELRAIHARLETRLGLEGARLDRIYHCPHHPDRGFEGEVPELKFECDCRKPLAGMILRAAADLPVDLAASCLIGDSWRDVGAARAAGLDAYGVRTGVGCRDCTAPFRPDLVFTDADEAAAFAVSDLSDASALADRVERLLASRGRPVTVGICGVARSGKSTLSHGLVKTLRRRLIPSLHVRLDDWIQPVEAREPGSTAESRCRVDLYPALLDDLSSGRVVEVRAYDPASRTARGEVSYRPSGARVRILDGLFACHEGIRDRLDLALLLEIDEREFATRFREFYRWKGDPDGEIERRLASRVEEELQAVRAQRKLVDDVLTPVKLEDRP
ncbi:MAG: HAD-IIIA family hydrolase [Acidobacteriia bacterium]|nr:HAD-IIIA family hydrolase [Terriglobia bacterium]